MMTHHPITNQMFGVEHYYKGDDASTYDIFQTIETAQEFVNNSALWNDDHYPLFIFKALFNLEHVYYDDDNEVWSYDDHSDTIIGNIEKFQEINKQ